MPKAEGINDLRDFIALCEKHGELKRVKAEVDWNLELSHIAKLNEEKAQLLYQAIDNSGGFYHGHAQPYCRSLMNVTFRMETTELEGKFAQEALAAGMVGLKGHRSVGGLRASIYNACPLESIQALVDFMAEFQRKYG